MSQHLLGITEPKNGDFAEWYHQVITKGELIDYYDISGCYVLREAAKIWRKVQNHLNDNFQWKGIEEVYFPLFVSKTNLEKEASHIEDFAPEVLWVNRQNKKEEESREESKDKKENLEIALRPTSETIMYPYFKKWLKSYRELPLRYNQWANIVRWEFKSPTPLIRSREFLWQEGHTVHQNQEEAEKEALKMLKNYQYLYQEIFSLATIPGRKTENEKFAGSDYTLTVETFISETGRGIQAATSHMLGQNFSKMFDIQYTDIDDQNKHVWQTSWGLTTRSIGIMAMVHGDDRGLIIPPAVAPVQVVLIPVGIGKKVKIEDFNKVLTQYQEDLIDNGNMAIADLRPQYSPPWKYNYWERKGIPIRIEVGPRELKENSITVVSRVTMTKVKYDLNQEDFISVVKDEIHKVSTELFIRSKQKLKNSIVKAETIEEMKQAILDKKMVGISFCGQVDCEENLKKKFEGVKSLCQPFEIQFPELKGKKCLNCQNDGIETLFGKSY